MSAQGDGLPQRTVSVTGAGGFIGSWLVRLLLLRGYDVRGTLRDPEDPKNDHLRGLEGARERLALYKADVLDFHSLRAVFDGCGGVFHVASPVTNDPGKVKVAVEGTKNAMDAAADAGVRRFVFTSSIGAVHMNPNRSPDEVLDESCWSDLDFCKKTGNWYCYAKMLAEVTAMEKAKEKGLDLLVVAPPVTVGPMLQPVVNASVLGMMSYVAGKKKKYHNAVTGVVDVRDVARAHLLVYENQAASGRYLCIGTVIHFSEILAMLAGMFPEYPIPTLCEDEKNPEVKPYKFSSKRLEELGLQFTPIKQSLYETVKSLQEKGHLPPARRRGSLPSSL